MTEPVLTMATSVQIPGLGWTACVFSEMGLVQSAFFFNSSNEAIDAVIDMLSARPTYVVQPKVVQPKVVQPKVVQPKVVQLKVVQPKVVKSAVVHSAVAHSAVAHSEVYQPGCDLLRKQVSYWNGAFTDYFARKTPALEPWTIPLDDRGWTAFQKRIYVNLRDNVGWGETISYGELAMLAGHPGAARAVGTVMAQNSWGPFIPCHRVLGARGRLGGYSGMGGLTLKQRLLDLESGEGE